MHECSMTREQLPLNFECFYFMLVTYIHTGSPHVCIHCFIQFFYAISSTKSSNMIVLWMAEIMVSVCLCVRP